VDEGVDSIIVFMKEAQVSGRAFLYLCLISTFAGCVEMYIYRIFSNLIHTLSTVSEG